VKGSGAVVLAVVGVLVGAALLVGCGSDSSTNASATGASSESTAQPTSGPLTKAEFIKQVDQICRKGVEEKEEAVLSLAKLAAEASKPPSSQVVEKVAKGVVFPTYSDVLGQLGQLEPPAGDESKIEKMLGLFEADLEAAEAEPIKATKVNMFADANDAAKAYGFESCRF
jgi:hypothetical protein